MSLVIYELRITWPRNELDALPTGDELIAAEKAVHAVLGSACQAVEIREEPIAVYE